LKQKLQILDINIIVLMSIKSKILLVLGYVLMGVIKVATFAHCLKDDDEDVSKKEEIGCLTTKNKKTF
jgi:hypothetical protein